LAQKTRATLGVRAPSDLGGRWPYSPQKLRNARKRECCSNALKSQ